MAVKTWTIDDFQEKLGYSEIQAINLIYRGGLQIHTTKNTKDSKIKTVGCNSYGFIL